MFDAAKIIEGAGVHGYKGSPLMFSMAVIVSGVILASDTTELLSAIADVLKASYQLLAQGAFVMVAAQWIWRQARNHFDNKWEDHDKQHAADKSETAAQHEKDKAEIMTAVSTLAAKLDGFMAGVRRQE